ncbi:MAG: M20/M25/M40 family metallo-hydrolase [Candidatus Solibacter usitatus]|nr:M20/M25/M40 family metallo-hydrolase [Candidatus Solibacter usitatus]
MYRTLLLLMGVLSLAFAQTQEPLDLSMVHRIRAEALQNSKVMDHMFNLTDANGHRLTGSPGYKKAADWVVKQAQSYGLSNAHLEKWGPFGRGWDFTRFSAHLIEPTYAPLIGFPLAWSEGTKGPVRGEPVLAVLRTNEDLDKFKGKLKGKIVLADAARETPQLTTPLARRYSEEELDKLELAPEPGQLGFFTTRTNFAGPGGPGGPTRGNFADARQFRTKRAEFLKSEGVLAVVSTGTTADGGTVFSTSGGSEDPKRAVPPPMIVLTPEHYNRILRLLEKKIPVKLELEVEAKFYDDAQDSWNVIAEIPGGKRKDEIVMIGAHLDSWHGGTGATDNAAGSSVALEVLRVLKSLNVQMDRTIRMGLWSGEEQGLLGSKAYVKERFADPTKMELRPEHSKLAGYFNLDNGTGKIRGVYLQGNDMVRPIFAKWLEPFKDLGASRLSIRTTGGTDHLSFDAVGIPGFQFIQEPMEYSTRTHHSNMDVYDHISRADLMQASAIMASFVYNTAMRAEMLPRKPLPKPQPERRRGEGPPSGTPSGGTQ